MVPNPYLEEYFKTACDKDSLVHEYVRRSNLVEQYSWAIPNQAALTALVELSPLVEIGCGLGYWASLITQMGGDIIAYDKHALMNREVRLHSSRRSAKPFINVLKGTHVEAGKHSERTLFLCWPPYDTSMSYLCLKNYLEAGGKQLAYVGEGPWGCTGTDKFHDLMASKMVLEKEICIPQWQGLHDALEIWRVQ